MMKKKLFILPLVAAMTLWMVGCGDGAPESPVSQAPIADTGLVPVDSSAFSQVGYDAAAQELTVVFRDTGSTYVYSGIPTDVGQAFMNADSLGGYYHANIRDQYESREK